MARSLFSQLCTASHAGDGNVCSFREWMHLNNMLIVEFLVMTGKMVTTPQPDTLTKLIQLKRLPSAILSQYGTSGDNHLVQTLESQARQMPKCLAEMVMNTLHAVAFFTRVFK